MNAHWMLRCVASSNTGKGHAMAHDWLFSANVIGSRHVGGGSENSSMPILSLGMWHASCCTVPFWSV